MIYVRKSEDREPTKIGWLNSKHTFSFGQYYDERHMGVGPLRVINEDKVIPGAGFGAHPHQNMEIISYVLEGALEHKDSIGTGSVIRPGDVQRMSAGTGVAHSEYNHSKTDPVHFLQIWIVPETQNLAPSYEQKNYTADDKRGRLKLVGSPDGRDGSVTIHQDVNLYAGLFDGGEKTALDLNPDRTAWVQVARGGVFVNGERLDQGDGAQIANVSSIGISDGEDAEILVFDLPLAA
ncbi:MAG: pirin family protein [Pseudomonadota bacterium]